MSRAGGVGGAAAAGRRGAPAAPRRLAGKRRRPARSGGDRGGCQAPELEDVVGGVDELPFGGAGPLSPSRPRTPVASSGVRLGHGSGRAIEPEASAGYSSAPPPPRASQHPSVQLFVGGPTLSAPSRSTSATGAAAQRRREQHLPDDPNRGAVPTASAGLPRGTAQ